MASMEELLQQQRARIRNPQSFRGPQFEVNPFYQTNPFEPTSQLSNIAGDPQLGEPLPSGRFVDQALPSPLSLQRMQQAQQTTGNVQEFLRENGTMQLNEQSLIDKGKTMLSRLFDYQDDKDAQLFGINVSAVETVWDGALRYITGFYDLLSLGYGGLISAAPAAYVANSVGLAALGQQTCPTAAVRPVADLQQRWTVATSAQTDSFDKTG
jgi:hypothetical protein